MRDVQEEAIPGKTAERALRRAIELQATHGEIVTETDLASIAQQLDIHPLYLERALAEAKAEEAALAKNTREVNWDVALFGLFLGTLLLGIGLCSAYAVLQIKPASAEDYAVLAAGCS